MKKPGGGGNGAILLVGLSIAMLAALFGCGIIAYLLLYSDEGAPPSAVQQPAAGNGGGGVPHQVISGEINVSGEDMELWSQINEESVEVACLQRAKEEAGASADLVFSCECEGDEGPLSKSFDCSIETADPLTAYFADIDCSLAASSCRVETNYGTANVSFREIREYMESG